MTKKHISIIILWIIGCIFGTYKSLTGFLSYRSGSDISFVKKSFALISEDVENVKCSNPPVRRNYCLFEVKPESIDNFISFYQLNENTEIKKQDLSIDTIIDLTDEELITTQLSNCLAQTSFNFTQISLKSTVKKDTSNIQHTTEYLKLSVEVYEGNEIISEKISTYPEFKSLFYDKETGIGCMQFNYPYG